jgi:hypothetical protein
MEAMTSGLPAMRADIKTVDTRASSLEAAIPTLATRHDMEATAGAVDVMRQQLAKMPAGPSESDFTALAERVNKLEVAVATAAAATGSGDGASSEGLTALAGQVSDAKSELTALAARLKDAEGKIATLGNGEVGNGAAAVRAMAVVSLRRAASGSQPFEDEVDGLAALGGAPDLVAKLRPYATTGVKSQSELAATFSATADAIITATTQSDSSANFFTRVLNGLSHLVSVRPAGPVAGDDPPAVVSRMTAAVNKGDLAAALKERQSLPEGGQVASAAWAKDAEARVALDGLVETAARSLASPAGTG